MFVSFNDKNYFYRYFCFNSIGTITNYIVFKLCIKLKTTLAQVKCISNALVKKVNNFMELLVLTLKIHPYPNVQTSPTLYLCENSYAALQSDMRDLTLLQ